METALRAFTLAGAHLTFDEAWKGPLKAGYAADLAVLSGNPATSAVDVRELRCLMTIVNGATVHDRHFDL